MAVFLTLGPITFANYEIPPSINFGGQQALSTKKLVGGERIIDSMGRDDDEITWSGRFRGSTGLFRARYLDNLRVQGMQMPLFYSQFNYTVVIKSFKASFERFYEIPYTITVEVLIDNTKPLSTLFPVSYNDAVENMLIESQDLAAIILDPSVSSATVILAQTLNAIPDISNASANELASVGQSIGNVGVATENVIESTTNAIFGAVGGLTAMKVPEIKSQASALPNDELAAALAQLSNCYIMQNLMINMQANLDLISQGANGVTITVNGANLFQLAAKYYADATLWTTIARANNLVDTIIEPGVIRTLVIPANTTDTGGILQI